MAGVRILISSLITSIAKLLPGVKNCIFAQPSSSSIQSSDAISVVDNLNELMRLLERIKKTLCDAEEMDIMDSSTEHWLKELKEMGHEAEYVIDEYMYEVYGAQVEARNAFELNPDKRNKEELSGMSSCPHSIRIPDRFVDRIRVIRKRFDEISKDREALRFYPEDGWRRDEASRIRAPSSHLILESNVFGRERDKAELINLLLSNINEGIVTVISIIGKGGLGKTTLAQSIYNDKEVKRYFSLFGWICVSEEFNVVRLMQEMIESFTGNSCSFKNLGTLQEMLMKKVVGKEVLVVLDDVWNKDEILWDLFRAPFRSALRTTFIITTRSDQVAEIMQTTSPYRLGCLSEKDSWSLFKNYAFGGFDHNVPANLLNLGRQIAKKCGGLPLAIKSISNLLPYQDEKIWMGVLENNLWEYTKSDTIYGALQISYNHMPAYLRPCFLYCSLFPKDYEYNVDELTELWIAEGYIESKGRRTLEEVAFEYAVELRERSFFDDTSMGRLRKWSFFDQPFVPPDLGKSTFRIHNLVHDLAQLNSGREIHSIERIIQPNPSDDVMHTYLNNIVVGRVCSSDITGVRTFIFTLKPGSYDLDFSESKRLRVLKLQENEYSASAFLRLMPPKHLRFLQLACNHSIAVGLSTLYHLERLNLSSVYSPIDLEMLVNLTNLQSLTLSSCRIERTESLGSLRNLRIFYMWNCSNSNSNTIFFPETVGNLVHLQKLVIHDCSASGLFPESLCKLSGLKTLSVIGCGSVDLPRDIGNLTNLQCMIIRRNRFNYMPPSFSQLNGLSCLDVEIKLRLDEPKKISWLKNFDNLKGTLYIREIANIPNVEYAKNFNLISKHNVEELTLDWSFGSDIDFALRIEIEADMNKGYNHFKEMRAAPERQLQIFESLQPHPNLKSLKINHFDNPIFPRWMGDGLSCASLEKLRLCGLTHITRLPFRNLDSLKYLEIWYCPELQAIKQESMPPQLQSLNISCCSSLISIIEMEYLDSLAKLYIRECRVLKLFSWEFISKESYHKSSSCLKNLTTKKVEIRKCPSLQLAPNQVIPSVDCHIDIYDCDGLKEWCLQHNISYTKTKPSPPPQHWRITNCYEHNQRAW